VKNKPDGEDQKRKPVSRAGDKRFWRRKPLASLSRREWEALCDRCGMCCVHKLEDEHTGQVYMTNVACRLLDVVSCQCSDYRHRRRLVPDCIRLTADNMGKAVHWLPASCAYRRLWEGKGLPMWHPLVTGDPESTERAGMSARDRLIRVDNPDDLSRYVID
jgi:uncharacterized cysteine cluster protein YcgN (CxxCxxCC family)